MYASEDELDEFEVNMLWDAANNIDDTTKIEVYKVIQDCCNSMQEDTKLQLITKL